VIFSGDDDPSASIRIVAISEQEAPPRRRELLPDNWGLLRADVPATMHEVHLELFCWKVYYGPILGVQLLMIIVPHERSGHEVFAFTVVNSCKTPSEGQ